MLTTLQQKLIDVATPIVQHYFTDVTEHDTLAVSNMEIGEVRMWFLRNTGTWMCVLKQEINANVEFRGLITKLICRPDEFNDGYCKVFVVHKTSEDDGEIVPVTYEELQYLKRL
jgi:hypothetical protein